MPQLTLLVLKGIIDGSLASHGNLLVDSVKAWNGHSKLQILNLSINLLPVSVCRPLLVAIATNCPCLEELDMGGNFLSGCLGGFLQNPPPALRKLGLCTTFLETEDMESLAAAVTAGKLQHLKELDLSSNKLSEAAMTPPLHALLNTLGDRELELQLGDWYFKEDGIVTIAPSKQKSAGYYLEEISTALCSGTASTSPTNDSDSYTSCSSKPPPRKLKKRKCNIQ